VVNFRFTIVIIMFILSVVKRFDCYESLVALFRHSNAEMI